MIDRARIPEDPGCYLFSDSEGAVIYVGKAKNLKKRVSSYFQKRDLDAKTRRMVETAVSVDFIVTDTEVEALLLENTLIKKHRPKFNIDLKDSKGYAYIRVTDEPFPRIHISRTMTGTGSFYGPFVSARERDEVLRLLKTTFRLRSCRQLPKRACLRSHIGSCSAPCIGKITEEEYGERVRRAEAVLKGDIVGLIQHLRVEMAERAAGDEFEKALELRDQIAALERLTERQNVQRQKTYDEDVINYIVSEGTVYLMLFNVHTGMLAEKHEFVFEYAEGFLEEFLARYYAEREPPKELILPEPVDESIAGYLTHLRGNRVRTTVPQRGEKKKLLDLVRKNIEIGFFGDRIKLEALRELLNLSKIPTVIECFDISHLAGTAMVGSMVQFRDGRPDKRNYRRFRIRSVKGIDDFAAMAEVVRRRYARQKDEGRELPDLIVIDGGKGQLSAATAELGNLGLVIPIIGIAKREEEIYVPGESDPLPLNRREKASLFIQEIRDEAHRFALAYHKTLRKKAMVS
ncbi:excinuclease ABC subunit C [Methanoculleus taiwanensis]|uniref:UvrABC system protein C n=1 Tax=Methanoculleus taiwanensis TaxID=1550565 RepID=A0A498GYS9_9EURY|nr:excinuclease ABC subunit UvrC [Methanoculleus taiwanensis]RXE55265.1 excinuclease ABC subunit C [Methanoculleus taiwanensis]